MITVYARPPRLALYIVYAHDNYKAARSRFVINLFREFGPEPGAKSARGMLRRPDNYGARDVPSRLSVRRTPSIKMYNDAAD